MQDVLSYNESQDEKMGESSSSYPELIKNNPVQYAHFKKQFHEIVDKKLKKILSPQKQLEQYKELYKKRKSVVM